MKTSLFLLLLIISVISSAQFVPYIPGMSKVSSEKLRGKNSPFMPGKTEVYLWNSINNSWKIESTFTSQYNDSGALTKTTEFFNRLNRYRGKDSIIYDHKKRQTEKYFINFDTGLGKFIDYEKHTWCYDEQDRECGTEKHFFNLSSGEWERVYGDKFLYTNINSPQTEITVQLKWDPSFKSFREHRKSEVLMNEDSTILSITYSQFNFSAPGYMPASRFIFKGWHNKHIEREYLYQIYENNGWQDVTHAVTRKAASLWERTTTDRTGTNKVHRTFFNEEGTNVDVLEQSGAGWALLSSYVRNDTLEVSLTNGYNNQMELITVQKEEIQTDIYGNLIRRENLWKRPDPLEKWKLKDGYRYQHNYADGILVETITMKWDSVNEIYRNAERRVFSEFEVVTGTGGLSAVLPSAEFAPNPTEGFVYLSKAILSGSDIKITDMAGNVFFKTIEYNRLDLTSLDPGYYIAEFKDGERLYRQKILKK